MQITILIHNRETKLKADTYIMENDDECLRMDIKTDFSRLESQAKWAGLKRGMSVADIGCGSGITSSFLKQIVGESGSVTGIDGSMDRINYARKTYGQEGLEFINLDLNNSLDKLQKFDFIWVRFFLEYHKLQSFEIVKKLTQLLNPHGIICLIDLDHNCLNHYGLSKRLENAMINISDIVENENNFDPYAGRKLYSYLYDLGLRDINVDMNAHHLIYGELSEIDEYNWLKKIEVIAKKSEYSFNEYSNGYDEFLSEFKSFFKDPGRFTYTPIISCRANI
ncbi:MAG: methyltransferase domain-containing protein [Spirochaetales bacterium]|nr:methyltransferase domain-containing protein [Spirochaetales bacterium]